MALKKPNFLYKTRLAKTNPVTRHDSAILIPKDRPQPVSVVGIGQEIRENYFSESEDRWIMRLAGPLPARAATATVTYKDGGKESFRIDSLAGRTEYNPGAYKAPKPDAPTKPPVSLKPAKSLLIRSDLAALVEKVIVITHATTPKESKKFLCSRVGNAWTTGTALKDYPGAVYQIWWKSAPPGVPHHQNFYLIGAKVSHVMPDGRWNPPSTRTP